MKAAFLGICLAVFLPAAPAASRENQGTMLGPICDAASPPPIAGPHRLVRVAGMGNDRLAVDTANPDAQAWFDYGLTLARSFEHGDAILAFQKSEALDPACSLCGDADLQAAMPAEAAESFRAASALQDRFTQPDPPPWWFPVRRSLAEVLMRQGDAAGAEREAAKVLQFWKRDPVTLEIRARAREALHQPGAAEDHRLAVEGWRGKAELGKVLDGKA